MGKKVGELTDLINRLEHFGISFEHGSGHNYLKIAHNPMWDKHKKTLCRYVLGSINDKSLNFNFSNLKKSPISYVFSYGWVSIIQIKEPNQREYSVYIVGKKEDAFSFLDYITIRTP